MKACARQTMAFLAFPASVLWTLGSLTILSASVQSNVFVPEDDPYQPVTTDETVSVGGTVTLTCRVMESDNSSLQWSNTAQQTLYFGAKRALRDSRIQLHRSTPTELSITIGEVQLSDDGDYTCSIFTKPIRTARATVTVLGVPGKPQILTNDDVMQEGGSVTLICSSSGGKPAAKLRWSRGEEELTGWTETVHSDEGDKTFTVRSELQLTVSRDDNGAMITCTVDHPSLTGGDEKTETELRVLFSPHVEIKPLSDLPREGEKFHLECKGTANPDPSSFQCFQWERKMVRCPELAKVDGSFLRFEVLNKSDNGVVPVPRG
ncbi:hypothetical protein SKAU_G00376510 [Synaphobranchus kaupii]|uniref:Ig-like domain-containing protein n=1 Tax=Synaphobranchus kaupii TaxID=118154 RepID=A0A9Q1ECS7_SYNKA|nr:hypothetical protein SKAU_G00376510 [Synaphobranchus kaupii]